MRGLQEAVEQREKETHAAKRQIKELNTRYESISCEKEELELTKAALEAKLNEYSLENKFYREMVVDMKAQAV
jgi:chromosome segregation ATPase